MQLKIDKKKLLTDWQQPEKERLLWRWRRKKTTEVLDGAKEKSSEIVSQAEKRASEIIEEAKQNAKIDADRIIANAKSEIQQEVNKAKENLRTQVASLAIEGAQKILEKEIDAKTHSAMLTKLSKDL